MDRLADLGIRAIKIHPPHQLVFPNEYLSGLKALELPLQEPDPYEDRHHTPQRANRPKTEVEHDSTLLPHRELAEQKSRANHRQDEKQENIKDALSDDLTRGGARYSKDAHKR
jgi:hypothetical protein